MAYRELITPLRTIMTPGPVEADPRVLRAMSTPILGQFDPAFTHIMNETMEMLRQVFQTKNHWSFPIDGTSRSGLEAVLTSVLAPGDRVLIPIFGRFGHLLAEIAERNGAEIHIIETEWGQVFDQDEIIQELKRVKPKVLAIVHGETSTGCMQPLNKVGKACHELGILSIVDAVATIAGTEVEVDEWQLDAVIGGTQKCFSVPSGMAPITYNERIEKILAARKKVERGVRTLEDNADVLQPIRSNYFDLSQLQDYWGPRRLNHHTEATSMLYALREGARVILEEGLEERFARHRLHEKAIMEGIKAMGLTLFNDVPWKRPMVTCVNIPEGIDGEAVRSMLLEQFGIEIASSFGPLHGKIWRIGAMGYSCRKENVFAVLAGLEASLIRNGAAVIRGEAIQAALDVYEAAGDEQLLS
ncbi:pyridoxal-phosphate-dependent aminotransferase family protein [Jeotgalibacillus soli]|uniref:Aminotransferase class V domain-containing protein n=1 Tax=Jeotgalibacillus soli TaxID=889306 RepID=A0A0C2RNU9_9BACL|nr:alanine--glyoxylate aminotransferase family protein [Jeotgalibacillus soli]KIL51945.1 hypothetical protein KP78_03150 [Jeotgalibacillus soli]